MPQALSFWVDQLSGVAQSWLWLPDCLTDRLFISGIPDVPDLVLRLQVAESISCSFQTSQILPWVLEWPNIHPRRARLDLGGVVAKSTSCSFRNLAPGYWTVQLFIPGDLSLALDSKLPGQLSVHFTLYRLTSGVRLAGPPTLWSRYPKIGLRYHSAK